MKNRISKKLAYLKEELRKRAVKEKDEEKRDDLWRLYFAAKDAEQEVRELVTDAEMRNVLEIIGAYGLIDVLMEDEKDNLPEDEKPKKSDSELPDHEDDIPPKQKGLWD